MKNQIVTSIAAIPFALGGLFAGAANAASFGQFQLGSGVLVPDGISTVTLSDEALDIPELDFSPEPTPIRITSSTGIFTSFDTASIEDIISFGSPAVVNNPFIDFGNSDFGDAPGVSSPTNSSISDGVDTFELYEASYRLSQSGENVAIDVDLGGNFIIGGETYKGQGNLTFQYNDITVAQVESILTTGGSLENMTFSGALFTTSGDGSGVLGETTPEPATLFGLGVVAAGLVASRRQNQKNS